MCNEYTLKCKTVIIISKLGEHVFNVIFVLIYVISEIFKSIDSFSSPKLEHNIYWNYKVFQNI